MYLITWITTQKANLTMLDINLAYLESLTADRTSWRALCRQSIGSFEDSIHIAYTITNLLQSVGKCYDMERKVNL